MSILEDIFNCEYLINDFKKCLFIGFTVILKASVWKCDGLSDSSDHDLDTNDHILQFINLDNVVDDVKFHEDCENASLPIREKDYCLDAQEFREGVKGLQAVLTGQVKETEGVEGDRHWPVVNEGDVKVARRERKLSLMVDILPF